MAAQDSKWQFRMAKKWIESDYGETSVVTDGPAVELNKIKKRLKEMEEEQAALRELQAKVETELIHKKKVEKEMGAVQDPDTDAADQADKEEVDARSIFVGNVDYECTPEEIQQHFVSCGTVNRVTVRTDKFGKPKGYAFVEFVEEESVHEALLLNGSELHGRQLKVKGKRTNIPGMNQRRADPCLCSQSHAPCEAVLGMKQRRADPCLCFQGHAPCVAVPGMKKRRANPCLCFQGHTPCVAAPFYFHPYGYGKVPRSKTLMRYNPYL
ncbi:unnamed protein product [Cuscuta europaea]|uniref:RRM domain-containing protein n=1 Tax=Cuscuta europaea TaxID=41803 RepID=A0A9P1DXX0_CUSEU|nr:unnamed protein product [Cuscuta europaea]